MTQIYSMEDELQQYLNNIGLTTSLLKSTSQAHVDEHRRPSAAAAAAAATSNGDCVHDEEDDDGNEAARPSQRVSEVTAADDEVASTQSLFGADADPRVSDAVPTVTESLTCDSNCRTATASSTTPSDCSTRCENSVPHVTPLGQNNSDDDYDDDQTSTLQQLALSTADSRSIHSYEPQTLVVNGKMTQLDSSELFDSVTPQSSISRSAVVFSTVPRHVDSNSTPSSHQTSQPPSSSSSSRSTCTVMLTGPSTDVAVTRSPTTHRAAAEDALSSCTSTTHRGANEDASHAMSSYTSTTHRVAAEDAPSSYTSTIIRCSTSAAPVIATSANKSRDTDAPAVDDLESAPPAARPHIKTTPNYVSVVQIGSATPAAAVDERRALTVTTAMLAESINSSSSTARSSLRTDHHHQGGMCSDVASSTPIKSSLKKVSPSHAKSKSVSFSAESADDDDDALSLTVETSAATHRADGAHRPSLHEAVVRLERDRVDVPRRTVVSDSGVFCEPEDDLAPLSSDDSGKVTAATPPSRRTTVIVSGGVTSIKNTPRHPQRQQLTDPQTSAAAGFVTSGRTLNVSDNAASLIGSNTSLAKYKNNVASNINGIRHLTTEDNAPDVRRKTRETTQVIYSAVASYTHCISTDNTDRN